MMQGRDILSIANLHSSEIMEVVKDALAIKCGKISPSISGAAVALLFEKPSLRTRVSFDLAIHQLGGYAIDLSGEQVGLGQRETLEDMSKVLSRYVQALVVRTFSQTTLEIMAHHANIPVVNALSDQEHPCQALADILTIYECRGTLAGLTIAYIGDGNNVACSLALATVASGMSFRIASPKQYKLPQHVIDQVNQLASTNGGQLECLENPKAAISGADVVYTDVWTSMGQESEERERSQSFMGYQVNEALLALANPEALFLHPMPAHYGQEVPAGFLNHPQSVAYIQAENRLHVQKAILAAILGAKQLRE